MDEPTAAPAPTPVPAPAPAPVAAPVVAPTPPLQVPSAPAPSQPVQAPVPDTSTFVSLLVTEPAPTRSNALDELVTGETQSFMQRTAWLPSKASSVLARNTSAALQCDAGSGATTSAAAAAPSSGPAMSFGGGGGGGMATVPRAVMGAPAATGADACDADGSASGGAACRPQRGGRR
ncbi:hypothetical protein [Ramlibacter sp.]|uniref:hypothetical protein n=1 Tax=Ramlibacter sp. TaxID=1917967 RepID=UPI003D0BF9B9